MQNRYVGDVADFAKYGLLRFLSNDDHDRLRLGLVWYLHHDQRHGADAKKLNYDGKYTSYLVRTPDDDRREFRDCDSDLWDKLRDLILRDARCVHCVEEAGILPEDTAFYDAQLHYVPGGSSKAVRAAKITMREYWFHGALRVTEGAGLVCVDPDNGIASDEKMHLKDGPKHVYLPDLKAFWERGQSLVIYHHLERREDAPAQAETASNLLKSGLAEAEPIPLLWHRGSARIFFVVPRPDHERLIKERVNGLLKSPWGKHFECVGR